MASTPSSIAPVFFAHGAPTLANEDTAASRFLKSFAANQPKPKAIVVLSAHWETPGLQMSAPGPLRTYHDFRGFPAPLYDISYPAHADLEHVEKVRALLEEDGETISLEAKRGLDHGVWVPLSLAYPNANIPVIALSLPFESTPSSVYALGQKLSPLKDQGVLLAGSGSTTHNLRQIGPQGSEAPSWAIQFDEWLDEGLRSRSITYFDDLERAPEFRQRAS